MKEGSYWSKYILFLVVFTLAFFALAQVGMANGPLPLKVRVQPSGDTFAKAYVITGETRTYFGNVEGGTPGYSFTWEFSDGDSYAGGVGNPRFIPIDHTFATAGTHWAILTVQDSTLATSSATINLKVIAAASDDLNRRKNSAIDRGLRFTYLNEIHTADGSWWPGSGQPIASTGMALLAFENHGHNLEASDDDIYKKSVEEGVRYLLNNAYDVNITSQDCIGDPEANDGDSDNDGKGVVFSPNPNPPYIDWSEGYINPIAVLAIVNSCTKATAQTLTASTTDPSRFVNGKTLWDIIVDAKDFIAFAQSELDINAENWWGCGGGGTSSEGTSSEGTNSNVLFSTFGSFVFNFSADIWGLSEGSNYFYCTPDDWNNYVQVWTTGLSITDLQAWKQNPIVCPGTFTVNWGDGSSTGDLPGQDDSCPGGSYLNLTSNPHTYASPGTYTVTVSHGDVAICSVDVTVTAPIAPCPGNFTVDWGDGSPPEVFASYSWYCPNEAYIDGISHTYAGTGPYTVSVSYEGIPLCSVVDVLLTTTQPICDKGGWRYFRNSYDADNSVTQWPVLALAEARSRWDINVNPLVITLLDGWLAYSQCSDGGFGYTVPNDWCNFPKTGAGLVMLKYCGYDSTNSRVQNALSFLDDNWDWTCYDGNLGGFYGMYAFYKGMKMLDLTTLGSRNWEELYTEYLVGAQNNSWCSCDGWFDCNFATYTALAILAPAVAGLPPVADAGGPYPDVSPGQVVNLDGSGSYHQDPTKNLVKYEWDFDASDGLWWDTKPTPDPGEGATGVTVATSYPTPFPATSKTYTVTLRVTDDSSPAQTDTDTATVTVTVANVPPVPVTNGPWSGLPGDLITFDGTASYDPNSSGGANPICSLPTPSGCDEIVLYEWDLNGDGIFNGPADGTPVTPNRSIVTKSFPEPVSLPATLCVTDSFGARSCSSATFNIVSIAIVYGQEYNICFKQRYDRNTERWGIKVRFKNLGNATAGNVIMTLTQTPTNLTILKGVSNLGNLNPCEEKWTATSCCGPSCDPVTSSADIELKFDRRIVPTGQWRWKAEFDFGGKHYIVDNLPPLGEDTCP